MKRFKFKKIDAFATGNSEGNPAGYIHLNSHSDITETEMLKIAQELKGYVTEVGFIVQTLENEFDLKYYSAEREVDFCGHATIAIMYDLISNNSKLQQFESLRIKTNRGRLKVENRIARENAVFIMSPVPDEKNILPAMKDIAENLKIRDDEINTNLPVSIINAGLTTLLVPVTSLDAILGISPDIEELKNFCFRSGIDIIEVFSDEVADSSSDFRARVFAPVFGYLEDPATGSGNSALGYYLISTGKFCSDTVIIEQNKYRERFNIVKLQKQLDENGTERVLFGGGAITRVDGEYILP